MADILPFPQPYPNPNIPGCTCWPKGLRPPDSAYTTFGGQSILVNGCMVFLPDGHSAEVVAMDGTVVRPASVHDPVWRDTLSLEIHALLLRALCEFVLERSRSPAMVMLWRYVREAGGHGRHHDPLLRAAALASEPWRPSGRLLKGGRLTALHEAIALSEALVAKFGRITGEG